MKLVKHEIRDLQILEIFEFEIMKFATRKLKSSKRCKMFYMNF